MIKNSPLKTTVKKLSLIFCTLFFLSACSSETCIDADDFGNAKFTVSARYSKDQLGGQVGENQIAPWINSNYRVNGRPLTILVKGWEYGLDDNSEAELSAWCPWYGTSKNSGTLSSFCQRLQTCQFIDEKMCTRTANARIANPPCIFKNGVGLYALITKPFYDPNQLITTQKDPDGLNFHLGEPTDYKLTEVDKNGKTRNVGGIIYNYKSDADKRAYVNGNLYFKILDKFYDDNNGQYRIVVKSGLTRSEPDPISYGTKLVKEFLFGVDDDYGLIRNIYKGIVNNSGYRLAVSALLTLYIIFTALSFLAGNIQVTHTELIVRVGKIAIISALLSSEYSWTFFNDYLFVYFIGGVEQILNIIVEAGSTGPGSPNILSLMIAPETLSKLLSLLFVDWRGFIYILLFIVALYFVLMVFFEAAIIYLTALIAIGMIITLGPIFICFMLFPLTRSLFENWLKQLISYAIQPIILFTGLIFISMILRQEIYGALGFRVCKYDIPQMKNDDGSSIFGNNTQKHLGSNMGNSIFYWWFPHPMKGENFSRTTMRIPIPIDHFKSENEIINTGSPADNDFCQAYECIGDRYVDLPFLDPKKDIRRINQFWNGQFVQLDGLLIIFVAIYLLVKFNELSVAVARLITGTSGNLTNLQNVSDDVMIHSFVKSNRVLSSLPSQTKTLARKVALGVIDAGIGQENRQKLAGYTPSALIDRMRISALKKDALSENANKAILDRVKRSSGLKQTDIDKNAITKYEKSLIDKLKKIDSTLTDKNANKLASELKGKKYSDLKAEFAKAKYGKEYDKLSNDDKKSIDVLTNDRELRTQAKDALAAQKFQEAYVDAYVQMSDQGIGLLGKHSKTIRTLEEIKHDTDERKRIKKMQQRQTGEEIISKYEGLKNAAYSTIAGDKSGRISRNLAGGAWHEINTDPDAQNYRKQTYAEIVKERENELQRKNIDRTIEDLSRNKGINVTSPEFLAQASRENHSDLSIFRDVERQDINSRVHNALSSGEDPALMGHTYMSKYAKNSEMEHMIDRAYEIEQNILAQDEFIHRQEEYEERLDIAQEYLKPIYETLTHQYPNQDITKDNMKELLQNYHAQNGLEVEKLKNEIEELQSAIDEYHNSQEILQQIDNRKMEIEEEIDKHVADINKYRTDASMEEYKPERALSGKRKLRKIEDLKRGD